MILLPAICTTLLLHLCSVINAVPTTTSSTPSSIQAGKLVIAYVPDWTGFKASAINYTLVTHVHYSFASLDVFGSVIVPAGLTPDFIKTVHAAKRFVTLTIGGWGTTPFSQIFSTAPGIVNATTSISKIVSKLGLDGIEIDWEFPGGPGAPGNKYNQATDTANYLAFLKALRLKLGSQILISACGIITPFIGSNGLPITSTTEFAKVLDFVMLMAYDINGSWNTVTGPNAPLQQDLSGKNPGSVVAGISSWTKSGFPANKIVLGTA
ncbi:UNVERIFIED_CONTAM: hypothetical protein HDU68_005237, partial [Siphonaria sp. JEL0065]